MGPSRMKLGGVTLGSTGSEYRTKYIYSIRGKTRGGQLYFRLNQWGVSEVKTWGF